MDAALRNLGVFENIHPGTYWHTLEIYNACSLTACDLMNQFRV